MFKTLAAAGSIVALAGCAVAPGYDYGYAQPGYYGYAPGYAPAYGGVDIGIWGGGHDHYHGGRYYHGGDRGPGRFGGGHGGPWHGGGHGGGGHGGGGHGGGGHGGGGHGGGGHGGR